MGHPIFGHTLSHDVAQVIHNWFKKLNIDIDDLGHPIFGHTLSHDVAQVIHNWFKKLNIDIDDETVTDIHVLFMHQWNKKGGYLWI